MFDPIKQHDPDEIPQQGHHKQYGLGWEGGGPVQTIVPDVAVDIDTRNNWHDPSDLPRYDFDPVDAACACQRKFWDWIAQGDCSNLNGVHCRTIIGIWVFCPIYKQHSLTDMAKRFGKKKQSLGRAVADFKKAFPELRRLSHIRNDI